MQTLDDYLPDPMVIICGYAKITSYGLDGLRKKLTLIFLIKLNEFYKRQK